METRDGTVYENADFITEWIPYEEPENTEDQPSVITSAEIDEEVFVTYLDALKKQELSDLEGEVVYKIAAFRQQGTPSEKIEDQVRQIFIKRWKLFDYAEKEGIFFRQKKSRIRLSRTVLQESKTSLIMQSMIKSVKTQGFLLMI